MSSIHDGFALIKKIAEWQTLEEVQALANDDDTALEIAQEYKDSLGDDVAGIIATARQIVANHPYDYIDFSGRAIREHYFEHDKEEQIEGLSDQDLQDAGDWALNSDFLWDQIYDAWDYGVESVRSEQQKRETS